MTIKVTPYIVTITYALLLSAWEPTYADNPSLRAVGIIAFGAERSAIVEIDGGRSQEVFEEGSTLPGGYIIRQILKDRLIVEKNRQTSILPFLNSNLGGAAEERSDTVTVEPNLIQDSIPPQNYNPSDVSPAAVTQFLMPKY